MATRHHAVPRLVADNTSGSRFAIKQAFIGFHPNLSQGRLDLGAIRSAVGKATLLPPIAHRAGAPPQKFGDGTIAPQRVHNLVYCHQRFHRDPLYSSSLKKVKGYEAEMIHAPEKGRIERQIEIVTLMRTVPEIAERLHKTRKALGLNQTELCRLSGIAKNTYNQWEKGHGRPELDKAMMLCDAFDLTLDWIYLGNPAGLPYHLATKIFPQAS